MIPAPALVLVHGGAHTSRCWQPTVDAIRRRRPEVPVLAVDLPGRTTVPGDLATLTIGQCVASVLDQIQHAGLDRIVLVGHSMAGITMPGVISAFGPDRVAHAVYIACCVPPDGDNVISTLRPPVSWLVRLAGTRMTVSRPLPGPVARWMFANGMRREDQRAVVDGLVPESATVTREPVDRSSMPRVPTTWVLPLRDHSLPHARQHEFIANLGSVDEVVEIDTCHNVMMSEPDALAEILLTRTLGTNHPTESG